MLGKSWVYFGKQNNEHNKMWPKSITPNYYGDINVSFKEFK